MSFMFPSGVATTYNDGVLDSGFSGSATLERGMMVFMAMDAARERRLARTPE